MLTLHYADELEPLLDTLAGLLAQPPADPFIADVVAVPSVGMSDAVMAGLGVRNGIVANVEFLFPGQFIGRALGDTKATGDPWSIDRLTWYVLELITQQPTLLPWVVPGETVTAPWATARRIADLFDRYSSQRPQMITAWHSGVFSEGRVLEGGAPVLLPQVQRWQPELWTAVRAHIAQPSPPERMADWLAQAGKRPALPTRVHVFGFGSLSATMLAALRGLAPTLDVHVFLRVPSRVAWESSSHRFDIGQLRDDVDVADGVNHPLLGSWGIPALETRALVAAVDGLVMQSENRPIPDASNVLGALQHGLRLDRAPTPVVVDPNDQSFQVHACHGALRQLEVLRDTLCHAFVEIEDLAAHEVLVLCPDIEQYAPLIESVLGRGALPVPVHVGDRALTVEEPIHAVLQGVLRIVGGRAALSDVLSVAQLEPVRRAFGWSVEDVERLSQWCSATGARWGLTPEFRTEWLERDRSGRWSGMDDLATGTWEATCDRLLAGVAMTSPEPRLALGDVVPYDDMGADESRLAGSLADFLARLVVVARFVSTTHTLTEWTELMHSIVDQFCATDRKEGWRLDAVHGDLDDLVESATTRSDAGVCTVPLSLADLTVALGNLLADRPGRLRLRTGAVTVTSTVPLRGVSARVVALLGLDEGVVRVGGLEGDDLLSLNPCVGDRSPRFESRHLLLDALLAARERLIVTCNGADLTTNKEVPFVVALTELLEVIRVLRGDLNSPAVVRHPRHVFNEVALAHGKLIPGVTFTFDTAAVGAAVARRKALLAAAQGTSGDDAVLWGLPPQTVRATSLDDLVATIMNPARTYLRERLDVVLPREGQMLDDSLSLSIEPLEQATLGRRLFDAVREQRDLDAWRRPVQGEGALPPGDLGTVGLDVIIEEVQRLETSMTEWAINGPPNDRREFNLDGLLGEGQELTVRGEISNLYGNRLAEFRFAKRRPSYRLGLAVRLAALQYAFPDTDWEAVLVRRATGKEVPLDVLRIAGTGKDRKANAARLLRCALQVYEWALRDAVPLFERASEPIQRNQRAAASHAFGSDLTNNEWTRMLWGDVGFDDMLEASIPETDPDGVQQTGGGRGAATANWVWGTYGSTIEMYDHKAGEFVAVASVDLIIENEAADDE